MYLWKNNILFFQNLISKKKKKKKGINDLSHHGLHEKAPILWENTT